MDNMYKFTSKQCLDALENWPHEPFTEQEYKDLRAWFLLNPTTEYGLDDVNSLLLEILDEINN